MSIDGSVGKNPPGVKRVAQRRPDGSEEVYLYAWRGKGAPRLYEPEGSEALWTEWREALKHAAGAHEPRGATVTAWLSRWRRSADFARLAPSTQRAYERHSDRIAAKFGDADPRAFCEPAMRREVKAWRDSMASTPAAADKTLDGLLAFLAWLLDEGVIGAHVCGRIARLSDGDRSDKIWEASHQAAFRAGAQQELVWAMEVARLTAFACAELVRLEWTHFDVDEIAMRRQKTGELALVPILPELRDVVARIPRRHARVITNSRGKPYSPGSLSARMCEATKALGIDRTLHDLRRTACTELIMAGLDDRHVAEIMGWGTTDVAALRRRYCDRAAIIRDAVARIADHRKRSLPKADGKLAKAVA